MVRRLREPGGRVLRAAWPGLAVSALVAAGCDVQRSSPAAPSVASGGMSSSNVGGGGSAGIGTAVASGGGGATGGVTAQGGVSDPLVPIAGIGGNSGCTLPTAGDAAFAEQIVSSSSPAVRELYSWTTREQVAEIRAGKALLTREEREGLGPGYAIDLLKQRATESTDAQAELAQLLTGPSFAKARYAWSNPWATRLGFPGEDYGDQLLRLLLREEALLVVFRAGSLSVVDMHNASVPLTDALKTPERIAGIFFFKDSSAGGATCGTFTGGGSSYREFIIGNEAMIEEWSLGTQAIRDRVLADANRLEAFLGRIRACPEVQDATNWGFRLGCSWSGIPSRDAGDVACYEAALALASPYYVPAPAELVKLIDTLRGDSFVLDPLVVRPGG